MMTSLYMDIDVTFLLQSSVSWTVTWATIKIVLFVFAANVHIGKHYTVAVSIMSGKSGERVVDK